MKNTLLLFFSIILLASCRKETGVKPVNEIINSTVSPLSAYKMADTIADGASFKVRLWTDSTNYDETMFIFRKTASVNYSVDEDALYMPGSGKVGLASISKDIRKLAINTLPFRNGLKPQLYINSKTVGTASLGLSSLDKIPSNFHVWLRDKYLRDSVNLSAGNYKFNITADSNSFGARRFQLVLRFDTQH
jgi:hypothetical protein